MLKENTLWHFLQTGGFTMYILLTCSVISLTIIFERIIYYKRRSGSKRTDFMAKVKLELPKNGAKKVMEICVNTDTPYSSVVHAGFNLSGHSEKIISEAMEREITVETVKLERFTSIVGTIGSTAVYIGLFGTVLGIIRAFRDISQSASGGISIVIRGISEALVCTAAGLAVAVPAVIAYNYFIKRIDNFITDMDLCASETLDLVAAKK